MYVERLMQCDMETKRVKPMEQNRESINRFMLI